MYPSFMWKANKKKEIHFFCHKRRDKNHKTYIDENLFCRPTGISRSSSNWNSSSSLRSSFLLSKLAESFGKDFRSAFLLFTSTQFSPKSAGFEPGTPPVGVVAGVFPVFLLFLTIWLSTISASSSPSKKNVQIQTEISYDQ